MIHDHSLETAYQEHDGARRKPSDKEMSRHYDEMIG